MIMPPPSCAGWGVAAIVRPPSIPRNSLMKIDPGMVGATQFVGVVETARCSIAA
jgi:hypothetical protein